MKLIITADIDDARADLNDPTGVTERTYGELFDGLTALGLDDIQIRNGERR